MKKRIMITGSRGFVGRNIMPIFWRSPHYELFEFDSKLNEESLLYLQGVKQALRWIRPDVIINLAAQGNIYETEKDLELAFKANVLTLERLVRGIGRIASPPLLVHISTWEVCHGAEIIDENSPTNPCSYYALTKKMAEDILKLNHRNHVILRLSSVFGYGMREESMISKFIDLARENKPIQLYGNPLQFRQWTWGEDIANYIMTVIEKPKVGQIYNVATPEKTTNLAAAEKIIKILKSKSDIDTGGARLHEVKSGEIKTTHSTWWGQWTSFDTGLREIMRERGVKL